MLFHHTNICLCFLYIYVYTYTDEVGKPQNHILSIQSPLRLGKRGCGATERCDIQGKIHDNDLCLEGMPVGFSYYYPWDLHGVSMKTQTHM